MFGWGMTDLEISGTGFCFEGKMLPGETKDMGNS